MKTNSISTSIPKEKTVRGYTIKRMPLGQFLKATQLLQDLPTTIMQALFPDADASEVLNQLKDITRETLIALFVRALSTLPEHVLSLFAELSGIPSDQLNDDPNIGLDGLIELADAWVEVNGIENFIKAAGALVGKVRKMMTASGYKG